jgi:hypothetical protein
MAKENLMQTTTRILEIGALAAFTLGVSHLPGEPHTAVLQVAGVLDHRSYEEFIDPAAALHMLGKRQLIIDLHQVMRIELSGLFALHSIARLYGGERLLNPEVGWLALQAAAGHVTVAMREGVKLLAPPPAIARTIRNASFCRFLEVYAELPAALASLAAKRELTHG